MNRNRRSKLLIKMAAGLFAFVLSTSPVIASCVPAGPLTDQDITKVGWSSFCFVDGPKSMAAFRKLPAYTQPPRAAYSNRFRGAYLVPLIGTYENGDAAAFNAAVALVKKAALSTIRLQPEAILDGCDDYVSITTCGQTLTVSDFGVGDEKSDGYRRLQVLLAQLNKIVSTYRWHKTSDETTINPPSLLEFPR